MFSFRLYRFAAASTVLTAASIATLVGCGSSLAPPDLQSVSGIVVSADGKPFTIGGLIEFKNRSSQAKRSTSAVDLSGHFILMTDVAGTQFSGAFPGEYDVAVYRAGDFLKISATSVVTIPQQGGVTELSIKLDQPEQ